MPGGVPHSDGYCTGMQGVSPLASAAWYLRRTGSDPARFVRSEASFLLSAPLRTRILLTGPPAFAWRDTRQTSSRSIAHTRLMGRISRGPNRIAPTFGTSIRGANWVPRRRLLRR